MSLSCGCEKGERLCATAEQLWRGYVAAKDIERRLFDALAYEDDDPLTHDRWRLAGDVTRSARRKYEKHVDGENEPAPEPQSLKADLRVVS